MAKTKDADGRESFFRCGECLFKKVISLEKGGKITKSERFEIIHHLVKDYSIYKLCLIAGVSRYGYYKWKKRLSRPLTKEEKRNQEMAILLREQYFEEKGRQGYRQLTTYLRKYHDLFVNHKRVRRLLNKMGLHARQRRKKIRHYDQESHFAPNLLKRNFKADYPNDKLCIDITYVYAGSKRYYLCAIIDLFNNEIIAYHLSDKNDTDLVLDTLKKAHKKRDLKCATLHSDQGHQFTSHKYKNTLIGYQIVRSMSRRGNCWDNAPIESFFSHYKTEGLWLDRPRTLQQLVETTDEYMDFYNQRRYQKKLGYQSPKEFSKSAAN
ncbi:IS3 family transposase [Bacillus sp. FJAT-42376]|uniref:IS3 family transposase n=1 Tax=Bacillus sp. FJAT-42376 TaxID=2014076 RepID=UPI0013DDC815|nr:IS3 family transposase [Bacillus sp. FJAT-42376]